jgi:CPA1 family monovalent cation:H+ antiporter
MILLVAIGLVALLSQWLGWRMRIPAILFLLAGGIVLGPATGLLDPDELFGDLLFPFVSLSVAAILFEGSLTLQRSEIKGHGHVVRNMITIGPLITWGVVACVTHWFIGAKWPLAFLFGAIMTVTGPTVIMPMLRVVRPSRNVANILRWEGILIDPVGAILAVLTFNVIIAGQMSSAFDDALLLLVRLLGAGLLVGAGAGYVWGVVLRRYWIPNYLQSVGTLLVVFAVFLFADMLAHEAGLLAVTVMGVWLANMRGVNVEDILHFKESLSFLLISGLFILLAARLDFSELAAVGWPALLVLLALQFVARPLKIFVCSIGSTLSFKEKLLLSWIGPRGIIAAAISALFALRLQDMGYAQAAFLVPLSFVVIAGTVILQSITSRPLAVLLGLANPEPEGVLFVGAHPLSNALANVLTKNGFQTLICSSSWAGLREPRMSGVDTYYGNPLSQHAEHNLDLTGIGKVFGISNNTAFNDLVCNHFATDFGRPNVFTLPVSLATTNGNSEKHSVVIDIRGKHLFGEDESLLKLLDAMRAGAEIKTTLLSEEFDYAAYIEKYQGARVPLVAWNDKGKLNVFSAGNSWVPDKGWTVAGLALPESQVIAEASATDGEASSDLPPS